jgi:hypothetical protein
VPATIFVELRRIVAALDGYPVLGIDRVSKGDNRHGNVDLDDDFHYADAFPLASGPRKHACLNPECAIVGVSPQGKCAKRPRDVIGWGVGGFPGSWDLHENR